MAYSSKNPKFTTEILTDQTSTAGVNAPTGSHRVLNRNGKLVLRNSAGTEYPAVATDVSGKNYCNNPDDAYLSWTASGAGVTLATTTTTGNLPNNISKATAIDIVRVSGTTDYVYFRFTLDKADYSKAMGISWDQLYAGSGGDYVLQVFSNTLSNYTGTSTALTVPTPNIPASTATFSNTVTMPGSSAPYIEVRIKVAAGTTHLYLSNVTVTPGAPAVYGLATTSTPGLYQAGHNVGSNISDNAAAGEVGEYIESIISSYTNFTTTDVTQNLTSVTLTAGDWDVTANIMMNLPAGISFSPFTMTGFLSGTSGSGTTGENAGLHSSQINLTGGSIVTRFYMQMPTIRVQSNGTDLTILGSTFSAVQVVYLKLNIGTYSGNIPQYRCVLRARRVR